MIGQRLTRTNNKPATRIAQPGQSGHTVLGFETRAPTRVGTKYDEATVTHATSNVDRELRYGAPSEMCLPKFVMRATVASTLFDEPFASILQDIRFAIANRPSIYLKWVNLTSGTIQLLKNLYSIQNS